MGHSHCCTNFEQKIVDSDLSPKAENQRISNSSRSNKLDEITNMASPNTNNEVDKIDILDDIYDNNIDESVDIICHNFSLEFPLERLQTNNKRKPFHIEEIKDPFIIQKGFEKAQYSEINSDLVNRIKLSQIISKEDFLKIPQSLIN